MPKGKNLLGKRKMLETVVALIITWEKSFFKPSGFKEKVYSSVQNTGITQY